MAGFASVGTPTTGGAGGTTVTVSTAADLARYAGMAGKYVIRVSGAIATTGQIQVTADKTIEGASRGAGITGGGLIICDASNVVVRNLTISKATGTDAISVYNSHHVWITQNDLSNDMTHDKDYYDGLIDITKGSDYVTVSYNYLHDHFKVMLIGAGDEDTGDSGRSRVTIHHNYFRSVNSRLPSLRFGTGHIYNNVFSSADTGVNSRMGAVVLLQANVFQGVHKPVITTGYSIADGRAVLASDYPNDFGGVAPAGTPGPSSSVSLPYAYSVAAAAAAASSVPSSVGPR